MPLLMSIGLQMEMLCCIGDTWYSKAWVKLDMFRRLVLCRSATTREAVLKRFIFVQENTVSEASTAALEVAYSCG